MLGYLAVAFALVAADLNSERSAPLETENLKGYNQIKRDLGHDPQGQIKIALWCEAHGLDAERLKHLALAVLADPKNATARGLMGLVAYQGKWQRPEVVSNAIKNDEKLGAALAEYNAKRATTKRTADDQWKLALWCEEKGLKAEAMAHFSVVTRLDPPREAAWKRLGFRKKGGHWVNEAQLAEAQNEAALQKEANRHWKPLLEKWRGQLASKTKRAEAQAALTQVTDPRAVPTIMAVFGQGDAAHQRVAVNALGQIDAPGASKALALLGVFGKSPDVRRIATETLKRRDPREFAGLLIGLLLEPIKYQANQVEGPGSSGELLIEGKKADLKRRYSPPPPPNVPVMPGDQLVYDANGIPYLTRTFVEQTPYIPASYFGPAALAVNPAVALSQKEYFHSMLAGSGLNAQTRHITEQALANATQNFSGINLENPFNALVHLSTGVNPANPSTYFSFTVQEQLFIPVGQMELEARKTAAFAQQQLQNDVQAIEQHNKPIHQFNANILPILQTVSGQDFGEDREAWAKWWVDQLGFMLMPQKFSDKATIIDEVPLDYQAQPVPITGFAAPVGFQRMSCFGAGTLVQTLAGLRPIETLQIGDQVLTQDIKSGALRYRSILVVHHNPPSSTFKINFGDETVVSSYFHRFWKVGHGWVMARDLEAGDILRTLGGRSRVESIEPGAVQPVFNLDVADDADFFVGRLGALVHDNTLPDLRLTPFDAPPKLAAQAVTPER